MRSAIFAPSERQREKMKRYCKERDFDVAFYAQADADNATDLWRYIMTDVNKKNLNAVICWTFESVWQDMAKAEQDLEMLRNCNVELHFVRDKAVLKEDHVTIIDQVLLTLVGITQSRLRTAAEFKGLEV